MKILELTQEFTDVVVEKASKPKFTSYELACMEGGHSIEQEPVDRSQSDLYTQLENFAVLVMLEIPPTMKRMSL